MKKIDLNNIPKHIAIILDGNGRWANKRMLERNIGHYYGALNLSKIVLECDKIGVKYLTVFAFSTENWKRPAKEVNYLMTKPIEMVKKYINEIKNSNIKIKVLGRKDRINEQLLNTINEVEFFTKKHTGLTLNICFDYGARYDIINATKKISEDVLNRKIKIDEITIDYFKNYLETKNIIDVDLLIRTSGEIRISNFLLFEIAYAELYFTKCLWPDFNKKELYKAINIYQNRNRRFGGLK